MRRVAGRAFRKAGELCVGSGPNPSAIHRADLGQPGAESHQQVNARGHAPVAMQFAGAPVDQTVGVLPALLPPVPQGRLLEISCTNAHAVTTSCRQKAKNCGALLSLLSETPRLQYLEGCSIWRSTFASGRLVGACCSRWADSKFALPSQGELRLLVLV